MATRDLKARLKFDGRQFRTGMQQVQRDIGVANKKISKLSRNMRAMGGTAIAAFASFQVIGQIVRTITQFEDATAELRAILLATKEETAALTKQAKELGSTSIFTASQVTKLQVELAKLGFTQAEIKGASEGVLNLAAATNSELAEAAKVAGATIRAFGLNARETSRIADVMTLSFSSSALNLEKFSIAMATAGPVAKAFGFSVEETTALIAQLVDAGFDASMAGTAVRNIFLNMADANGKLAKRMGGTAKSLPQMADMLIKLREEGISLNETLQLTDKRSVAAFNRFLEGAESAEKLATALEKANGTAETMAEERLMTMTGHTKQLNSQWEAFVLNIEDGDSVLATLVRGSLFSVNGLLMGINNLMNDQETVVTDATRVWEDYNTQLASAAYWMSQLSTPGGSPAGTGGGSGGSKPSSAGPKIPNYMPSSGMKAIDDMMFGETPKILHDFSSELENFREIFATTTDDFQIDGSAFIDQAEEMAEVWTKTKDDFVMGAQEWSAALASFNGDLAQNTRQYVKIMAQQALAGLLGKIFKEPLPLFATLAIAAGAGAIINGLFSGLGGGGSVGGGGSAGPRNIERNLGESRQGVALSMQISGDNLKVVRDRNTIRRTRIG